MKEDPTLPPSPSTQTLKAKGAPSPASPPEGSSCCAPACEQMNDLLCLYAEAGSTSDIAALRIDLARKSLKQQIDHERKMLKLYEEFLKELEQPAGPPKGLPRKKKK
ncbi:MAG: hypothetical protein P8018_08505 [Acidobacteriota bacterium]|jgi:hypothetical protein